jgi:hypothetical protein
MKTYTFTIAVAFMLGADGAAQDAVDFNRDIRPILSDKCFACHGPNTTDRQGGFRLDVKQSAFGAADSGQRPIVPGDPDKSGMLTRITSNRDADRMPPEDSGKSLSHSEIAQLRHWIQAGAPWENHWSFLAPQGREPPDVQSGQLARNPIDQFVLARLAVEGLEPAPSADRLTLLRRVTFDLTGLPATPTEADAFLADKSSQAFERVVDRLLTSDRYGEHMARFWLDAARYGDTHGLHLDNYREMWPYRDWVVGAFNDNLPYDQFAVQQLAGDLLSKPTRDRLIATGFNRAHVTTNEGGSITEEVHVRNVVDRVVTVGTVFMGMTFECTRCHDHKYDPFTMDDFYSMFAFFNSIDGSPLDGNRKDHAPVLQVPTAEQETQLADFDRQIRELEKKLVSPWPALDALQHTWEEELVRPGGAESSNESATAMLSLGDWYTVGPFSDNRRYLYAKKHGPEGKPIKLDDTFLLAAGETVAWTRRPEWSDGQPHTGLPGRLAANFLYRVVTAPESRKVSVSLGSDDAIKVYLNGAEVFANDVTRGVAADQETLELVLEQGKNELLIKIMNYGGESGFYFDAKGEVAPIPSEVLQIAQRLSDQRTDKEREKLREFFRNKIATSSELAAALSELESLRKQRGAVDGQVATTLIWREAAEPKTAYYLNRGEYDQPGRAVSRRTPSSLPPMSEALPPDRLGFARWLTDPSHPLTARVAVNRIWQQLFGTGIVKTAEDFGSQGERPSHPDLLDWLAERFMNDGWDVKAMMKRIVMSATYQQSSQAGQELRRRDPENRLLARGPRFRLDAEMLRDQALAISGLLVQQLGGPSVKPLQPDGLWFAVGYSGSNTVRFTPDTGRDKVHRRTLYTFIKRTAPPPQMSIMDAPSREACVMRRERTNTPLLSLVLFNDPQYVEAARALGERTMREAGTDPSVRAAYMFRLCTGRSPSDVELQDLVQGFEEERISYSENRPAAESLLSIGELAADTKLNPSELAAWTLIANMLLNLDEVVTKN